MSAERRIIQEKMRTMSAGLASRIVEEAKAADIRDPKTDLSANDCLMASGGGASALYRHVTVVLDGTVHYTYSNSPFGRDHCGSWTIEKWRQWARRATVHHWASKEIYIPGLGWQLHDDILTAAGLRETA